MDNNIVMDLNQQQMMCTDTDMLVVAGAGTGKTTSVTLTIDWLIEHENIDEDKILYLTFSNKAARDGKKKINRNIDAMTIHSMCFKELRNFHKVAKVITPDDIEDLCNMYKYDKKNANVFDDYVLNGYSTEGFNDKQSRELETLKDLIEEQHGYTYGMMMYEYYTLLVNRKYKPKKYDYLFVDEAQDLCSFQYKLIKRMAEKLNSNLVFVGDFRQCIYEFRGSRPDLLLEYIKEYDPKIINLDTTYRCPESIVELANKVACNVPLHVDMKTNCKRKGKSISIGVPTAVLAEIVREKEEGTIAVLSRTNRELALIASYLKKKGIPYVYFSKNAIYDTAFGRSLRYLTLCILHPEDPVYTFSLLHRVKIGLGPKALEKTPTIESIKNSKHYDKEKVKKLIDFIYKYHNSLNITMEDLIDDMMEEEIIEDGSNYCTWIKEDYGDILLGEIEDIFNAIESYKGEEYTGYAIRLSTVHASKGLEYDNVVFSLDWFIDKFSLDLSALDGEEIRILYVGITRTKNNLYLTKQGHIFLNNVATYQKVKNLRNKKEVKNV